MKKILSTLFILATVYAVAFSQQYDFEHERLHRCSKEQWYQKGLFKNALLANQQQSENQQKYDAVYYDLHLTPDPVSSILWGNVTMHAKALDVIRKVDLNLLDGMQVDSVFVNNNFTTNYIHKSDYLTINLTDQLNSGDLVILRIVYHGRPSKSGFGAFGFDTYRNEPMIWTLSEPFGARNWWPCKDIPADKADSVDIRVTVPKELIVASNGKLRSVTDNPDDTKTFWWHEQYPIVTYLVSLAIYPYVTFSDWYVHSNNDSMEVQFYMFPDRAYNSDVRRNLFKTVPMIASFSDLFGQYPFIEEKYGHAEFLWGGGMEHQTCSSMGGSSEFLIAHELAHQWWGDMITCESFHHIWLNEGFATYCEALWAESQHGIDALHNVMRYEAYMGDGTIYVENPQTDNIFSGNLSYSKASWVLHMLRHVVGDDVFFEILRTYHEQFKFKTANTEQFKNVCETVSGIELDTFFDQWIYKAGHPEYEMYWEYEAVDENTFRVAGNLSQTQEIWPFFEMPVDITINGTEHTETFVFENTKNNQNFEFVVNFEPRSVELDKDNWILKKATVVSTPKFSVESIVVNDSRGNANKYFDAGEQIELNIELLNSKRDAYTVSGVLSSGDSSITILNGSSFFGDLMTGDITNNKDKLVLQSSDDIIGREISLSLALKTGDGFTQTLQFYISCGQPNILLVDDDNGSSVESYYFTSLDDKKLFYDYVRTENGLPTKIDTTYRAVVWFTGNNETDVINSTEQQLIENYVQNGGSVLLTGHSVGADMAQNNPQLLSKTFGAMIKSNDNIDIGVSGEKGDAIFRSTLVRFDGGFGSAENQQTKTSFEPYGNGQVCLSYLPGLEYAGIKKTDIQTGAKTLICGFGIEGISGPMQHSQTDFLITCLNFLVGSFGSTSVNNSGKSPSEFKLLPNFPNPFNPSTRLEYILPKSGYVSISVYNNLGQLVKVLHDGSLEIGLHSVYWDGADAADNNVASGIYFAVLKAGDVVLTQKMLKVQ